MTIFWSSAAPALRFYAVSRFFWGDGGGRRSPARPFDGLKFTGAKNKKASLTFLSAFSFRIASNRMKDVRRGAKKYQYLP